MWYATAMAIGCSLLLGGTSVSAGGLTAEAARANWKVLAKARLAVFKAAVKGVSATFAADMAAFMDGLDAANAVDAGQDAAPIYQGAYSALQEAIEDTLTGLDSDASGQMNLASLPSIPDFMVGDGGTLDKAMEGIRKELAKFDKGVAKQTQKLQKEVGRASDGAVVLLVTLYPMPLNQLPHDAAPNLNGSRPNAPLFAFGVTESGIEMYGITGGITRETGNLTFFVDDAEVATIPLAPDSNGIYTHAKVFTVVPGNMHFRAFSTAGTNDGWNTFVGGAVSP